MGFGVKLYEDPIYGDEAYLIMVIKGKVIAADYYDVLDYKQNLDDYLAMSDLIKGLF